MTEQELKRTIDAAEKNPEEIARAVTGLSKKVLDHKPAPDRWSIHEILAHLADTEIVYSYRLRQVLADKEPAFAPIDQDDWASRLGYLETSPPEMVAQYALLRRSNVRLLRRLKPDDLAKGGFHPERGRKVALEEMLQAIAAHGPNHLRQIEALKQQAA
jgi:uncharacterized damage-inducible protein DinB